MEKKWCYFLDFFTLRKRFRYQNETDPQHCQKHTNAFFKCRFAYIYISQSLTLKNQCSNLDFQNIYSSEF